MTLKGSLPIGPQGVTNYMPPSIDSEEDEVKTSSTSFQLSEKAQLLLEYPVHTLVVADIKANVPVSYEISSEQNTRPVPFGVSVFGQTQCHDSTNLPLSPLLASIGQY